jgi:hypothetical protein
MGHAKAITTIIPVPLEGPAYFVSHGGEAFPSLIVVLQGYGVTAGTVTVKMTLSSNEQAFLAKHHGRRLKVNVKLLFTPTHGSKLSGSVTVLIG